MSLHLDHDKLGTETRQESGKLSQQFQSLSSAQTAQPKEKRSWLSGFKVPGLSVAALVVLMVAVEHLAPGRWRPSTFIGAFGGKVQTVEMLESLDALRAVTAMQEEERARAEQEVEQLRAAQERLTLAYRVEFERGNDLIRAGATAAQQMLAQTTESKARGMEGRFKVSIIKDEWGALCDLGNIFLQTPDCGPKLRASARADRDAMQAEIMEEWISAQAQIVGMARGWAAGLITPQELISETRLNSPHLFAAPRQPVPPNPYRTP